MTVTNSYYYAETGTPMGENATFLGQMVAYPYP